MLMVDVCGLVVKGQKYLLHKTEKLVFQHKQIDLVEGIIVCCNK